MTTETKALPTALLQPLVSRVRTDVHWKKVQGKPPFMVRERLNDMDLDLHLDGGSARGVCPIKAGESTTTVAVLDLDSHKGETSWEEMIDITSDVSDYFSAKGCTAIPFSSSGGKGVHLYFLWDEPQDAYSVRALFKEALQELYYSDGAGGVSNNQIEIFPKQDSVPLDGFGNMFILPYSGESVPLEPQLDYQRMPKDYPVEWPVSAPVPVVQKPERVVSVSLPGQEGRLSDALKSISCDLPYDQWLRVGQAMHHETDGSPGGLSLWDQWSLPGRDYPGFEELESKWETFGRSSTQPVTAGTIYKMATEAGWIDTPSADDFDVLPEIEGTSESIGSAARFNILPWHEFAIAKPFTWLIKQVMPKAALIVIYGPPGGGKSFWVLDAVNSIARGEQWRGKKVNQGGVLYICAEGAGGFRNRLTAYARHHNVDSTMPVYVLGDAPNLINKSDTPALLKSIEGLGPLSVIVVDTFAQVTPGSNENSSEGAGLALKNCRLLHDKTGATVILVAHSGKDATKGVRGWSGIKGACDCEIEITRVEDSDIRIAAITKQKDGEDQEQKYPFRLMTIPVGVDEDGDPVTSCYIEHTEDTPPAREKKVNLGEVERHLVDAVDELFDANNEWPDVNTLINCVLERLPESKTRAAVRKTNINRSLKTLFDREILFEKGGFVSNMNGNISPVQD